MKYLPLLFTIYLENQNYQMGQLVQKIVSKIENLSIRFSNNTPEGYLHHVPGGRYACYRCIGAVVSLVSCTKLTRLRFFFVAYDIKSLSARDADNVERRSGR